MKSSFLMVEKKGIKCDRSWYSQVKNVTNGFKKASFHSIDIFRKQGFKNKKNTGLKILLKFYSVFRKAEMFFSGLLTFVMFTLFEIFFLKVIIYCFFHVPIYDIYRYTFCLPGLPLMNSYFHNNLNDTFAQMSVIRTDVDIICEVFPQINSISFCFLVHASMHICVNI